MDSENMRVLLAAGAALVGGAGVGWWLRGRYNWSRSVLMDELWTRKIRSYETATEEARQAQTRDQSARRTIEATLEKERAQSAELRSVAEQLELEDQRLRGSLATHRERIENVELYAAQRDGELRVATEQRERDSAKIQDQQKRLKRLRAYPPRLEECEAELARVETRASESGMEKDAEIARLSDWIAELTPLTETLRRRDEEFARQTKGFAQTRESLENKLAARESQQDALRAQLRELEVSGQELRDALQAEQAARVAAERTQELRVQDITELQAQLAEQRAELDGTRDAGALQHNASIGLSLKITELRVELRAMTADFEQQQRLATERELALQTNRELSAQVEAQLGELRAELAQTISAAASDHEAVAELQRERKDMRAKLKAARQETEEWLRESEQAQESLAHRDHQLKGAASGVTALAERTEELRTLRASLGAKEKELDKSQRRATSAERQRDRKAELLEARDGLLAELREERSHLQKDLRRATREADALEAKLAKAAGSGAKAIKARGSAKKASTLDPLQEQAKPPSKAPSKAKAPSAAKPKAPTQTAAAPVKKAAKKASGKAPRATRAKAGSSTALSVGGDDFSQIKGIGPKLRERLADAGIRTYAQLASLGKKDIGRLAADLGVPEKRIQREGWLESATDLASS